MYGARDSVENQEQWNYLLEMKAYVDIPWVLIGDLNFTLLDSETISSHHSLHQRSRLIRPIVQQLGLIYLGYSGSSTTWPNCKYDSDYTTSRLDRALVNVHWMNCYSTATLHHIPHVASDHSPILLCTSIYGTMSYPF